VASANWPVVRPFVGRLHCGRRARMSGAALGQDALPARALAGPLACALDVLGAAAAAMGRRFGLQETPLTNGSSRWRSRRLKGIDRDQCG
jgi:hypothetical protein